MGVVIIDDTTVRDFVSDKSHFTKSVDKQFAALELNNNGVLSRAEIWTAFESMRLIEAHFGIDVATAPEQLKRLYDSVFDTFDGDGSGTVDRGKFRSEMKKIMLAIADEWRFLRRSLSRPQLNHAELMVLLKSLRWQTLGI